MSCALNIKNYLLHITIRDFGLSKYVLKISLK